MMGTGDPHGAPDRAVHVPSPGSSMSPAPPRLLILEKSPPLLSLPSLNSQDYNLQYFGVSFEQLQVWSGQGSAILVLVYRGGGRADIVGRRILTKRLTLRSSPNVSGSDYTPACIDLCVVTWDVCYTVLQRRQRLHGQVMWLVGGAAGTVWLGC